MGYSIRKSTIGRQSVMLRCAKTCLAFNEADSKLLKIQNKFTGSGDPHEPQNIKLNKTYEIMVNIWENARDEVIKSGRAYKKSQKLDISDLTQDKSK